MFVIVPTQIATEPYDTTHLTLDMSLYTTLGN